jgi:hypothetical protein
MNEFMFSAWLPILEILYVRTVGDIDGETSIPNHSTMIKMLSNASYLNHKNSNWIRSFSKSHPNDNKTTTTSSVHPLLLTTDIDSDSFLSRVGTTSTHRHGDHPLFQRHHDLGATARFMLCSRRYSDINLHIIHQYVHDQS